MEPKKLLEADYLDIIYDHRNKIYGGYELRRNYANRVKKGVGFLMLSLSALVCFSFVSERRHKNIIEPNRPTVVTIVTPVKLPEAPPPPPKAERIEPPPPPVKSKIFLPPKITDEPIKPDETMTAVKDLKDANPGRVTHDSGEIASTVPPITGPTGTGGPVIPPPPAAPLVFVDIMPQYPGDMLTYLSSNIHYPANAKEANIEGRVGVQFVVNEDGSISNVKVVHGIGGGCDEEAVRVIKAMPKWKPGRNGGVPVKVLFTQPIMFKLQ